MEDNARKYRPNTLEDIVHSPIFNSRAKTKQALTYGKTEEELFPYYSKLFDDIYESYCQNSPDRINRDAVYKIFSFPVIGRSGITLTPPFPNSRESLVVDPAKDVDSTKSTYPTTWAINAFIVLPVIIYILMAEQLNKAIQDTMKEESVLKMVFYVTRYHVGIKGLHSIDTHGTLSTIYGLPWTDKLIVAPNNIIAMALFISDCANTSLY